MTEVCTMRGTYIMAIACTYEGVLYGIGTGGGLYKINKETGSLTLVGNTGYMPWFLQSMEFDHTDNTLYWAGQEPTQNTHSLPPSTSTRRQRWK